MWFIINQPRMEQKCEQQTVKHLHLVTKTDEASKSTGRGRWPPLCPCAQESYYVSLHGSGHMTCDDEGH